MSGSTSAGRPSVVSQYAVAYHAPFLAHEVVKALSRFWLSFQLHSLAQRAVILGDLLTPARPRTAYSIQADISDGQEVSSATRRVLSAAAGQVEWC